MNSTPSYGVHRIMGAETEYGVIAPSAPGTNPTVLSALVVNTYAKLAFRRGAAFREELQRRALADELTAEQARQAENYSTEPAPATPEGQWLGESESPLRDAFGQVQDASTAHSSQMTHTRTELTSEDIALEIMREAGVQAPGEPAEPRSALDALAGVHGRGGFPERLDWDRVTMNAILPNGARLYVDHAHPEYSSPEVLTPADAVLYDAAGDALAYESLVELGNHAQDLPQVKLYKNNTDSKGQSYGAHENYLISRDVPFEQVADALLPFFATRAIFTGAGRVGIGTHGEVPGFQISSRADFFERTIGLETTIRRPIVNTRDEPHADESKYRRLHVIPADANMSHYSNLLKFGTAALVMNLIESHSEQHPALPGVRLSDPVAAMHAVSHDLSLSVQLPLAPSSATLPNPVSTSGSASVLQIQRAYYEASRAHEESNPAGVDAATAQILDLWGEVLDALETNPLSLADRLDWVAKYALVRGYVAQGVDYANPKLKALDLQYADIDPSKSLYHRLVSRGRMRTLFSAEQIERATTEPPRETRAFLRGTLMARWPEEILGINWDTVSCRGRYSKDLTRFTMMEPTRYGATEVEPLLDEVNHSDELLNRLR